jgi:acetyl esterase
MSRAARGRNALIVAGGALLAGGLKLARDWSSKRDVINLLDGSTDQSAKAQALSSQPIVRHPLTAGVRILGKPLSMGLGKQMEQVVATAPDDPEAGSATNPSAAGAAIMRMMVGMPVRGVRMEDRTIPGRNGSIPIRVYTPERPASAPRPLVVEFHGGGWSLGDLNGADWISGTVARDLDAIVVSVAYRLSPRNPFPAGVNDCFDALKWAGSHLHELGATAGRIGVMGQSAGANLAAVVSLMARDEGGPEIHHQALVYPAVDLANETRSHEVNADAPILDRRALRAFTTSYVGEHNSTQDWRFSPLRAPDLSGLPPALIQIAGHDPLYDDGIIYAAALSKVDVPVRLTAYAAMPHGFASMPYLCRDAKAAAQEVVAEQRRCLLLHEDPS